jgi:hypothetical protein
MASRFPAAHVHGHQIHAALRARARRIHYHIRIHGTGVKLAGNWPARMIRIIHIWFGFFLVAAAIMTAAATLSMLMSVLVTLTDLAFFHKEHAADSTTFQIRFLIRISTRSVLPRPIKLTPIP